MDNNDKIQIFEDKKIRTAWNEETEEWYFSIVDVVGVLTDSPNPNNYWKVLKKRLKDEGNESVTNCNQLKLKSPKDGKNIKQMWLILNNYSVLFSLFHHPKQSLLKCGWHK